MSEYRGPGLSFAAAAAALALAAAPARADVKIEERSRIQLEGMAGRVVGALGGKAAKEGEVRTVAVKGDRKLTLGESGGELVDLREEKVYRLDPRKKTYEVVTFAELRKQAEDAREAAGSDSGDEPGDASEPSEPEMEIDVDVRETGEKKAVNGFDTRQVVVTVTARRKGATLEQGGGTVITSDLWLAREAKGRDEVADFDRRYYARLYGDAAAAAMRDVTAALATQPGLGTGMERLRASSGELEGIPILTTTVVESVRSARDLEEATAKARDDRGGGLGGLGGRFARAVAKKVGAGNEARQRETVLTTVQELLGISSAVTAADVSLPAGYRPK